MQRSRKPLLRSLAPRAVLQRDFRKRQLRQLPRTPRSIIELFDDYDAAPATGHTSAPFVCERKGTLSLHFDTAGVQSLMDVKNPDSLMLGYTRTMMQFRDFIEDPRHIGMVGLGGGSLQKYCYRHIPSARISVAEISPEVIALRDRFRIPSDNERFQVLCENGVEFVRRNADEFDVLLIDGFDGTGQPPELCSQEFYEHCSKALTQKGILVVNICDSASSILIARLRRTFPKRVLIVDGENSTNTIAFASKETSLTKEAKRTTAATSNSSAVSLTPLASRASRGIAGLVSRVSR